MFKSSKPLIGATPSQSQRGGSNEFEFTPIGQENRRSYKAGASTMRKTDILPNDGARQKRNPLNNSPLANRVNGGSSFIADSSFDTIHQSGSKPSKAAVAAASSSSPFINQFQNHDLINNGSNPVKQQQENVSKLQEENYNLKVKIASLTRFLNSVTNNNQQEIYQQNSELQEKLIKMRSDMNLLTQELSQLRNSNQDISTNDSKLQQYKDEVHRLSSLIKQLETVEQEKEQLDDKMQSMRHHIEKLELELDERDSKLQNMSSPVSKSYVKRIEEQVEALRGDLEDREHDLRKKDEELDAKEDEIESLATKLQQLNSNQRSEVDHSNALDSQIDELKSLLGDRDDKISKYEQALHTKNDQMKTLKINSEKVLSKVEGYDQMISDLKSSLKNTKKQNEILQDQLQNIKTTDDLRDKKLILQLKENHVELEGEIDELKSKLEKSKAVIDDQKALINDLRNNGTSEREVLKLVNDFESLQKKCDQLVSERDSLKKRLESSDKRYLELKDNSERTYRAYEQLKKDRAGTNKTTHYDDYAIKDEIDVLANQVKDLNFQNKKLEQQLANERDFKKHERDSYEKHELKSLISKCNDLQVELSEKESLLDRSNSKYQREVNDYRRALIQKDDQISELKKEIKGFQLSTNDKFEDEKFELLKSKSSKDKEIKMLQFQLNEAKESHEVETKYLKKTIEQLRNNGAFINPIENESTINELLKRVEEKNGKIRLLSERLQNSINDLREYEKIISKLEQNKEDLKVANDKLTKKLLSLDEQLTYLAKEWKSSNVDEKNFQILQLKLKSKDKEVQDANRKFNEMKHELLGRYNEVLEDKVNLQRKVEKLVARYRQLQNSSNDDNVHSTSASYSQKQISFLQDQSDYYRMRYTKGSYIINDLKFVNSFMVKSIQATNSHIKKDIKKLSNVGIYPDYELICNKKPSLSVYFKFVVAAIRIKRKTSHSSVRNKKIEVLKDKLEVLEY